MRLGCGAVALFLAASGAAGQNTWLVQVSNQVSPAQPETTVEVWASFPEQWYAFAGSHFSVFADEPLWVSTDELLEGPGAGDGTIGDGGASVLGIVTYQLQWGNGIYADPSNPIAVWRGVWTTDDFTPRAVAITTLTETFKVYLDFWGSNFDFIDEHTEGAGVITVVPSPWSAAALAVIAALPRRRR